ncbi:MAG: MBL fold metallo-hydrolase [Clostridiales bacterium]|nr:MBL fold metallo-hydrolase [Clostridiales bacterium]
MRIADNVEMLEISAEGAGSYYPVLLWDDKDVVLIDTGFPHQFDLIRAAMESCGFTPERVTKVILTHQDVDHISGAKLLRGKGAEIMAHEFEAPYIQGDKPLIKITDMEAHLDQLPPERRDFYEFLKSSVPELYVHVDTLLTDGQVLPVCGGIEVILTPGHTPGHIALLLRQSGAMVCGDAANTNDGQLVGANPMMTHDMDTAAASFARIQAANATGYACYHTGYLPKS